MGTPQDRFEAAVDAAALAFHDLSRERWHPRWENTSLRLRNEIRAFVRPLVLAALDAAGAIDSPPAPAEQHPTSISRPRAGNGQKAPVLQGVAGSGMAKGGSA